MAVVRAQAAYHLLQGRARKVLEAVGEGEQAQFIREARATLHIEVLEAGTYTISWNWRGRSHSLSLACSAFQFYVRGDIAGRAPPPRGGLRMLNWSRAEEVWSNMASSSGVSWEANGVGLGVGVAPKDAQAAIDSFGPWAMAALCVFAVFLLSFPSPEGLLRASLAASLGLLLVLQEPWGPKHHLCRGLGFVAAVLCVAFFGNGGQLAFVTMAALAAASVCLAERFGAAAWRAWAAAGAVVGGLALFHDAAGILPVSASVALTWLLRASMPIRLEARSLFAFSAAVSLVGMALLVAAPQGGSEMTGTCLSGQVAVIALAALVGAFGLGWLVHELFHVGPWLALLTVGLAGVGAWLANSLALEGFAATLGYAGSSFVRAALCVWKTR